MLSSLHSANNLFSINLLDNVPTCDVPGLSLGFAPPSVCDMNATLPHCSLIRYCKTTKDPLVSPLPVLSYTATGPLVVDCPPVAVLLYSLLASWMADMPSSFSPTTPLCAVPPDPSVAIRTPVPCDGANHYWSCRFLQYGDLSHETKTPTRHKEATRAGAAWFNDRVPFPLVSLASPTVVACCSFFVHIYQSLFYIIIALSPPHTYSAYTFSIRQCHIVPPPLGTIGFLC